MLRDSDGMPVTNLQRSLQETRALVAEYKRERESWQRQLEAAAQRARQEADKVIQEAIAAGDQGIIDRARSKAEAELGQVKARLAFLQAKHEMALSHALVDVISLIPKPGAAGALDLVLEPISIWMELEEAATQWTGPEMDDGR